MHGECELDNSASYIFGENIKTKIYWQARTYKSSLTKSKCNNPLDAVNTRSNRLAKMIDLPKQTTVCHCCWCRANVWDVVCCASGMRRFDHWTRSATDRELTGGLTSRLPWMRLKKNTWRLRISWSWAGRMAKMLIFRQYIRTHIFLQVPDVIRIARSVNNFQIGIREKPKRMHLYASLRATF